MGYPTDHLVSRFEEALTIIRGLLREGALDFVGTYYRVNGFELRPRGPRPGGPPIMIGTLANRPRMLRLVTQYADIWNGWIAYDRNHADVVPRCGSESIKPAASTGVIQPRWSGR